jgi:lipopolysaccharide transport system ATP-binding protein
MKGPIIEVRNLSKRYHLGRVGFTSLRTEIERWWGRMRCRTPPATEGEFWALRDVSFNVAPGEVTGIIGRNGAGKSTLLKILSEITEPTAGEIHIRGHVASLLEVGTGFHPELSGRENIFLNGATLGMKRAEIRRKFDEIVAFADIEQFLETPVKRYSSGMYVRLAFAVAAHLEPEILLVDEVLAVGDHAFQQKCLGKMQDVARQQGRTVLFVSHNMAAVSRLCHHAIQLKNGAVARVGLADAVVSAYLAETAQGRSRWTRPHEAAPVARVSFVSGSVCGPDGEPADLVSFADAIILRFECRERHAHAPWTLSISVFDQLGNELLDGRDPGATARRRQGLEGMVRLSCRLPGGLLKPGVYSVTAALHELCGDTRADLYEEQPAILTFEVSTQGFSGHVTRGLVAPVLSWEGEDTS